MNPRLYSHRKVGARASVVHRVLILIGSIGVSMTAGGHHAQAPFFDQNRDIEIEGIVQRFDFRNPHPILYVEAIGEDGERATWSIQFASIQILLRAGIGADFVSPGEKIKALGHPSWDPGSHGLQGAKITRADGREFSDPLRSTQPQPNR